MLRPVRAARDNGRPAGYRSQLRLAAQGERPECRTAGARLVLVAASFAVAGAAKLADLPGSRRAVAAFGVPAGLAGVVGVALPLAELAVAVLLLPEATAWWGALGALVLLLLFCAAIGVSLARGRRPTAIASASSTPRRRGAARSCATAP